MNNNTTTTTTSEEICMNLIWMLSRDEIEPAHMITVYRVLQEELKKKEILPIIP